MSTLEMIEWLCNNKTKEKNLGKLGEECAELLEVVLKMMTRDEGMKPPMEKLVEELGDVTYRARVFIKQNGLEQAILDRWAFKSKQLSEIYNKQNDESKDKEAGGKSRNTIQSTLN